MVGPLIALAIPSIIIGAWTFQPLLFGGGFGESIYFSAEHHEMLQEIGASVGDWWHFAVHALQNPVFYLLLAGFAAAWLLYIKLPHLPGIIAGKLKPLMFILENKYGFDAFNEKVLAKAARGLGLGFWKGGDGFLIDTVAVDGSANTIGFIASVVRRIQSGFLYRYAFWMVIGLAVMLGWFLTRNLN